jgi:hypothetical protein
MNYSRGASQEQERAKTSGILSSNEIGGRPAPKKDLGASIGVDTLQTTLAKNKDFQDEFLRVSKKVYDPKHLMY